MPRCPAADYLFAFAADRHDVDTLYACYFHFDAAATLPPALRCRRFAVIFFTLLIDFTSRRHTRFR